MEDIIKQAIENHIPIVRSKTLEFLKKVCKENSIETILEIGTATGYSGIEMLKSAKEGARLVTIEKDENRVMLAKDNFQKMGVFAQVTIINDDAFLALNKLKDDNKKFDLIFLDGPKGQYFKYFSIIKQLMNNNAILFSDNLNLLGLINLEKIPHKHRSMVNNMKKFINALKNDNELITEFYDIDDGFSISKKRT